MPHVQHRARAFFLGTGKGAGWRAPSLPQTRDKGQIRSGGERLGAPTP